MCLLSKCLHCEMQHDRVVVDTKRRYDFVLVFGAHDARAIYTDLSRDLEETVLVSQFRYCTKCCNKTWILEPTPPDADMLLQDVLIEIAVKERVLRFVDAVVY